MCGGQKRERIKKPKNGKASEIIQSQHLLYRWGN